MTVTTKGYPTVAQRTLRIWPSVMAAILLLISGAASARAQSYTIMPTPFQAPLNDSGAIIVGGCVWTYAAGTTTAISTYTNTSGTTNSNPILVDSTGRFTAYLLAGTSYKFVYETACTPPAHGSVLRTADNIAGVPSAAATVDITCTAGETISAGQAVYLSAGSGGKTAGQCYKGDSANAYSSSTATVFGIAPSAIASGMAGSVRITGSVAGLSSLTTGSDYYIGTAGAITATAPANARKLGAADTATSVILSLPSTTPTADNGIDDFRLTLSTGVPVTTADVTAATTIFATPAGKGNRIALYDSSGNATVYTSAEVSIAVPATTSQLYTVMAFASGTTPTLELTAWTNDTTPGSAACVLTTTGTWTKSGDLTRRCLGLMRTTTVSGQTEDSFAKRYVWNYHNRAPRLMRVLEATDTWTYNGVFRQARATATNQLDFVLGESSAVEGSVVATVSGNATGTPMWVSIGEDSTTTPDANAVNTAQYTLNVGVGTPVVSQLKKYPAIGRHTWVWLEKGGAATVTWYGDNGGDGTQSGIHGVILG